MTVSKLNKSQNHNIQPLLSAWRKRQAPSKARRFGAALALCLLASLSPVSAAAEKATTEKQQQKTIAGPLIIEKPDQLPEAVRTMREDILKAASTGDLEELRDIFETNELAPIIDQNHTGKPIEFWQKISIDGTARDIMATMVEVFSRPPVQTKEGDYIWPHYARRPLKELSQPEEIDLFRMAGATAASRMLKSGKYDFYEAKIGKDGTWHSFVKVKMK